MVRLARLGGMSPHVGETPDEYAARLERVAPQAAGSFLAVSQAYGRYFYGPKDGGQPLDDDPPGQWGTVVKPLLRLVMRRVGIRRSRRFVLES